VEIPLRRMAKDGYVVAAPAGIGMGPLIPWLMAEGIAPPAWQDEDWATFDHRFLSGVATVATYDDLTAALDELCARHTREELMLGGLEVGSTIAPINTIVDLLGIDHLHTRGFWAPWGDAGATVRPGSPVTVDGQRLGQPGRVPDPDADGPALRAAPRRPRRAAPPQAQRATGDLPFSGIKVADFSWIGVGPITTKALADHGATVVRIESERRLDTLRAQAPFKDAVFGINRSNFYGSFNTSKWSLSVDLAKPEGLDIARRMTAWADVVLDSFRPGTMAKLGLSHDEIAASNPSVITVTTSLLGSGGPLSALAGYGFHAGAIAGFTDLVGWPDLGPDGPWMAYTDTIAPRILTTAVLAALDRRSRTGEGCHIECAQLEAGLHFLAPELLDYQLSGRVPTRLGNRDPHLAPQGAYPCAGEDEWCALTVADDAAWKALRSVLGDPEWASAPALATAAGRLAHHDDIDAHLAAWTRRQDAAEVERQLRAAGVPAGKVQRSCDLRTDPQYTHYGFYRRLEHAEVGIVPYSGHQYRIRGYDHGPRFAAPMLGQHTNEVLVDLLAMSDDDVTAAAIADALA
jgi:crotonobetainyl-CoA:carnitine CoA-transferase CaiB-like acyl-CoA transferase